ncbi:MAG: SDR family oxidoreductase [Mycobacterium sp.]|uniref:SDR family oxidoreductase n=1 Tax=Mycobacterium sp. TaxID=1785 RepID=UPI003C5C9CF2
MRCVILGATGYLGARLVPALLAAGHDVRVMARTPAKLDAVPWRQQVDVVEGDVTDAEQVQQALDGQQVLYYLVHSLLRSDFVDFDARAASIVGRAAAAAGLARIVYVGGIIPEGQRLSDHLASREEVGRLLQESGVPTVELRAAAIIGAGSASFEMLRYLTERLPLMVTPRWLRTRVQPIAVGDVLYYLTKAAELPPEVNRVFDIGGPDTFTYTDMIRKYAAIAGLQRRIAVPVPVLTPWLSSHWVNLITPLPSALAASLMGSLENDVVCGEHDIAEHIPDPEGGLAHYEDAVELALAGVREKELQTRWRRPGDDESPARPLPTDPSWAGGSLHEHVCQRRVSAAAETLWDVFQSVAAEHGWSAVPLAWSLRGWLGRFVGTAKANRTPSPSRTPHQLHTGEALDWWRVEHIDRPQLLRLRADIPLPGRLWLELSVHDEGDGRCSYRQRAVFQPYGLAGEAFWTAAAPFRDVVLGGMARAVASATQQRQAGRAVSREVRVGTPSR